MQLNVFLNINIAQNRSFYNVLQSSNTKLKLNTYPASHLPSSVSSIQDIFRFDLYHNNLSGFVSSLTDVIMESVLLGDGPAIYEVVPLSKILLHVVL